VLLQFSWIPVYRGSVPIFNIDLLGTPHRLLRTLQYAIFGMSLVIGGMWILCSFGKADRSDRFVGLLDHQPIQFIKSSQVRLAALVFTSPISSEFRILVLRFRYHGHKSCSRDFFLIQTQIWDLICRRKFKIPRRFLPNIDDRIPITNFLQLESYPPRWIGWISWELQRQKENSFCKWAGRPKWSIPMVGAISPFLQTDLEQSKLYASLGK